MIEEEIRKKWVDILSSQFKDMRADGLDNGNIAALLVSGAAAILVKSGFGLARIKEVFTGWIEGLSDDDRA